MADDHFGMEELFGRQLPFSLEGEQSVLGAAILDSGCIPEMMELLRPEYFYRQQHIALYSLLVRMFSLGETIDAITILNNVRKEEIFATAEDAKAYLARLAQIVPTTANVGAYAQIVREKYYLRSLIIASREIAEEAGAPEADASQLLSLAEQKIYDIREGRDAQGIVSLSQVLVETYDHLQKISGENRKEFLGISTGYTALDSVITGLNKSDLILLAARPGMGKTAFALNIATNVAAKSGKAVAVFSLEMSKEQLAQRILSSEALVESQKLRMGNLSDRDWEQIARATGSLAGAPLYIDDTAGTTVAEVKAKARRVKNLGLIVIDYLQLMSGSRRTENRVQEVSEITRNLKILAKDLNVPVITLSQLSRSTESRSDHRPVLSDLRESGSIEQDADIVLFLYREAYYNDQMDDQTEAKCIIAKNRHGETGSINLYWDGRYTRFSSVEFRREER